MITVYYEEYKNDYNRKNETKNFFSLSGFEDWFFRLCKGDYKRDISIPDPDSTWFKPTELPYRLEVNANRTDGCTYWVHMIRNSNGIIFSDGRHTNRQKHWNDDAKNMCRRMLERRNNPKFDFV